MRFPASRIRLLLIASVPVLASSCAGRPPSTVSLNPPAKLFGCSDAETSADPAGCLVRPRIPADALTSEKAFEAWRDDIDDWGKREEAQRYAGCVWLKKVGVTVNCGPQPVSTTPLSASGAPGFPSPQR